MSTDDKVIFQSLDNPGENEFDMNTFLADFDVSSKLFDCGGIPTPAAFKKEAMQYVGNLYYDKLNKSKYSSIVDNLCLVYGDTYVSRKDIRSFHLVESKIIHTYLGIQNLDKLFDEDFFNFEWDIHTQQDFSAHKHGYQRDHFVHQIRNLWMMDAFLERFGFYKASKEVLKDRRTSPISQYVSIKSEQMLADEQSMFAQMVNRCLKFGEKEANYYRKVFSPEKDINREYREEFFYKYVIFAASYLSALFHDLGYPVVHFLSTRRRLSDYSPASYMFTQNNMESFDMIANKLSGSLLFTIESVANIRKNMQPDADGKYDHGVYSAIPFLLHFYESGLIYRLAPEKVCAIELAAVAIYNHNLPLFSCTEEAKEAEYYKPYFNQNPIAFLLRTCDDLQEWDRRYFEITGKSDIMFCQNCHRPMMKVPYNASGRHRYGIDEPSPRKFQYICRCTAGTEANGEGFEWMNVSPTRQENFLKRKIYLIRACDSVLAEKVYSDGKEGKYILKVTVNYDLYRLLELSRFSFAKYRIKELNRLKQRLSGQNYRFQSDIDKAPEAIYVDYFLTSNPITIKVKILEMWLRKKNIYHSEIIMIKQKISECFKDDSFNTSVEFYVCVLMIATDIRDRLALVNDKRKEILKDYIKQGVEEIRSELENNIQDTMLRGYTETLVRDCFEQYGKELLYPETINDQYACMQRHLTSEKEEYESFCKTETDCDDTISRYCYGDTHFNAPSEENEINYFNDLYLFYIMNEEINKPS